jgi:hypothetical protein
MEESLARFPWVINTILKQVISQMVLHRPIECTLENGTFVRHSRLFATSPDPSSSERPRQRGSPHRVVARMLHQPPSRLHQPLLQTRQRPVPDSLGQGQPPPQVAQIEASKLREERQVFRIRAVFSNGAAFATRKAEVPVHTR